MIFRGIVLDEKKSFKHHRTDDIKSSPRDDRIPFGDDEKSTNANDDRTNSFDSTTYLLEVPTLHSPVPLPPTDQEPLSKLCKINVAGVFSYYLTA